MLVQKIKWDNVAWVNITDTVLSFPWPGLLPDMHFSISYHPKSDKVNLHLTRNVPDVPENNKPKIRLAECQKADMEEMAAILLHRYWQKVWIPFDMRPYQYRRSQLGRSAKFISITKMEKARDFSFFKERIVASFLTNTKRKRRGKEVHIHDSLVPAYERLLQQPDIFWRIMDKLQRVPRLFSLNKEFGYLYARDFKGLVLLLHGQWYAFRKEVDFMSILQDFLELDAFEVLYEKTRSAIDILKNSSTYDDTRPFDIPVNLTVIK